MDQGLNGRIILKCILGLVWTVYDLGFGRLEFYSENFGFDNT